MGGIFVFVECLVVNLKSSMYITLYVMQLLIAFYKLYIMLIKDDVYTLPIGSMDINVYGMF